LNDNVDFESLYGLTRKDPIKSLYLAVILQAIIDLIKPESIQESSNIKLQRDQAHAWVFSSVGVTCENFEDTCTLAGLEPGMVRTFTLNVIKSGDTDEVRRKINSIL
jgi:hypothetical protein|tara:strand:- start:823 stop:1143 length:321 start_codon:yes stop_codon:yes gene_type:complete